MKHLNIKIHGKVQGVFFRASTEKTAKNMGIKGFVRNEPDGTVYIEAEAGKDTLVEFLNKIKSGPPAANVIKIEKEEGELKNYEDFTIKY